MRRDDSNGVSGFRKSAFDRVGHTVLVAGVILVVGGCDAVNGIRSCSADSVPGLMIKVLDAATLQPVACGADVWAIQDTYSERMDTYCIGSLPDSLQGPWAYGAYEREGIYTVLVARDGYRPWSRAGIRVTADECHVQTVRLEALLVREAGTP